MLQLFFLLNLFYSLSVSFGYNSSAVTPTGKSRFLEVDIDATILNHDPNDCNPYCVGLLFGSTVIMNSRDYQISISTYASISSSSRSLFGGIFTASPLTMNLVNVNL